MVTNILYFHSILRYFILLFMIIAVLQSLAGMLGKKAFKKNDKAGSLILMILCDIQLVLGLYVFILNKWVLRISEAGAMKVHETRFFAMEHPLMMLISILLVHLAYRSTKKVMDDDRKFKVIFWCTLIALFLVLVGIPWPGMQGVGRPYLPAMSHL